MVGRDGKLRERTRVELHQMVEINRCGLGHASGPVRHAFMRPPPARAQCCLSLHTFNPSFISLPASVHRYGFSCPTRPHSRVSALVFGPRWRSEICCSVPSIFLAPSSTTSTLITSHPHIFPIQPHLTIFSHSLTILIITIILTSPPASRLPPIPSTPPPHLPNARLPNHPTRPARCMG